MTKKSDWKPASEAPAAPADGTTIRVRLPAQAVWKAYDPKSPQARAGKKGRWMVSLPGVSAPASMAELPPEFEFQA